MRDSSKTKLAEVGEDVTVGLAVNQMTEIITYVKGGDNFNRTLILTIGLVAICIVAYMYIFFENAIALLREKK